MFNTERFIDEIKKRPAIYDVHSEEYSDRMAKMTAWEEVCEIMVPKWNSLSVEEQNIEEKILRGKWRNIRDYFMKELKSQKLKNGNSVGRKRKKYMYFNKLLFLLPNADKKNIRSRQLNSSIRNKSTKKEKIFDEELMIENSDMSLSEEIQESLPDDFKESVDIENNEGDNLTYKYVRMVPFPKLMCETTMDDDYPDIRTENNDYDQMFLLSLLPIMRRIPEDKKLDVRIQMQQALASAIAASSDSTTTV